MDIDLPEVWPDWLNPVEIHAALVLWLGPVMAGRVEATLVAVTVAALAVKFILAPMGLTWKRKP